MQRGPESHPDLTAVLPGHADVADPLRLEAVAGEGGADGGAPGEAPGRERLPGGRGRGHPPGDQVLRPPRLHQLTRDRAGGEETLPYVLPIPYLLVTMTT